jgi:hypothetical protein
MAVIEIKLRADQPVSSTSAVPVASVTAPLTGVPVARPDR